MSIEDEIQEYEKIIQLIRDTLQRDTELRTKYTIAEKFRFVRDRLQGLLLHLEEQAKVLQAKEEAAEQQEAANQVTVYVYLYNVQGILLRSWSAMFTPKVFYEYSVNRPIYAEKSYIDSLVKTKANPQQHGYLTVKIKQTDILSSAAKDAMGNPIIRIREGSLRFENLVMFTHNGLNYTVTAQGELIKLES